MSGTINALGRSENGWRTKERVPMPEGTRINIKGTDIYVQRDGVHYEAGSSCLVYDGHIVKGSGIAEANVIIKEFYPKSEKNFFDIDRCEDGSLHVSDTTKGMMSYQRVREQFMLGLTYQTELAKSNAMEIAISPRLQGEWGDSYYVISEIHQGKDLKRESPKTLNEKLSVAFSFVEAMGILHENDYVMLDIKPENFLWIKKPNAVRIIDTDSVIKISDVEDTNRFFMNTEYCAPEFEYIRNKILDDSTQREINSAKKSFINATMDRYVMGIFLYKMFFDTYANENKVPPFERKKELIEQLHSLYQEEVQRKQHKNRKKDFGLIVDILEKLMIKKPRVRRVKGYKGEDEILADLQQVSTLLLSEKFDLRKEISAANANFAAYNLLQKYPLFRYKNEQEEMRVGIYGSHTMRADMLSAVISIGQMLDQKLVVEIVSEDADEFWKEYTDLKNNAALKNAVTWEVDGQVINSEIDTMLVERPLAHIKIMTKEMDRFSSNYYIILEEDIDEQDKKLKRAVEFAGKTGQKTMVAYLGLDEERRLNVDETMTSFDSYVISVDSFSDQYSEKMFSDSIYKMGLMVHYYYNGAMDQESEADLKLLEASFQENMYDLASSERSALHGIYKMYSIGIDYKKPGHFRQYFQKVSDPDVLEDLAWLEHLSWTAYLLTSGNQPISVEELDDYAYKNGNDWKKKLENGKLAHPLIVASGRNTETSLINKKTLDDLSKKDWEQLDPLDRVSCEITKWFFEKKDFFREQYIEWVEKVRRINEAKRFAAPDELNLLESFGLSCIDQIQGIIDGQQVVEKGKWMQLVHTLQCRCDEKRLWDEGRQCLKPVFNALSDRDYKKFDRDLTWAVLDIVSV